MYNTPMLVLVGSVTGVVLGEHTGGGDNAVWGAQTDPEGIAAGLDA